MANFVDRKSKKQTVVKEIDIKAETEVLSKEELIVLNQLASDTSSHCDSNHRSCDHHLDHDTTTGKSNNKLTELLRYAYVELLSDIAM